MLEHVIGIGIIDGRNMSMWAHNLYLFTVSLLVELKLINVLQVLFSLLIFAVIQLFMQFDLL